MVQAAEREHDGEQQTDGNDHRQVHDGAECNQIEHHVPPIIVGCRSTENPGELVGDQNGHQNPGNGQPSLDHLAQDIPLYGPFHAIELRALALI